MPGLRSNTQTNRYVLFLFRNKFNPKLGNFTENSAGSGRKHRLRHLTTEYPHVWSLLIASNDVINYEEHKTADTKPLLFIERFIPVKSTTIKMLCILGKK